MKITGKTVCYPILGHPVDQVCTPPTMNAWFETNAIDAKMFAMDIPVAAASDFFALLKGWANCGGCSVTLPHKQAAFSAMDDLTERARVAGAVNTVHRQEYGKLTGDMTDGLAFVAALKFNGVEPKGLSVVLAGAGGGAGAAIAHALCDEAIAHLFIIEPNRDRKHALEKAVSIRNPQVNLTDTVTQNTRYDIAINASPMGMQVGDPLPIDLSLVKPGGTVADVVTKPDMTPLLIAARNRGFTIQTGREMANAQLEFQMRHFRLWPEKDATKKEKTPE